METIKKAWKVGLLGWDNWCSDPEENDFEIVYADNRNEARVMWCRIKHYSDAYIEVKAKRDSQYDKVVFEGREMKRHVAIYMKEHKDWLEEMEAFVSSNKGKRVYIWSGQWGAYWRPNRCGYTNKISDVGVYDIDEAWNAVSHCGLEKKISLQLITS